MKHVAASSASKEHEEVIYLASDQPEACRWCGVRTIFEVLEKGLQQHECPSCNARYLVEDYAPQ